MNNILKQRVYVKLTKESLGSWNNAKEEWDFLDWGELHFIELRKRNRNGIAEYHARDLVAYKDGKIVKEIGQGGWHNVRERGYMMLKAMGNFSYEEDEDKIPIWAKEVLWRA